MFPEIEIIIWRVCSVWPNPNNSMNAEKKVANLDSMVSGHYTTLHEYVIMRTFCFDTDFASQMKLAKLPLVHCFNKEWISRAQVKLT